MDGGCKCPVGFMGGTCDDVSNAIETNAGRKSFSLGFIQCGTKSSREGATVGVLQGGKDEPRVATAQATLSLTRAQSHSTQKRGQR